MQKIDVDGGNAKKFTTHRSILACPLNSRLNVNSPLRAWQMQTERQRIPECQFQLRAYATPPSPYIYIKDHCFA